jgi:phenylalanine-4-hydroxylase
MQKLRKIPRHLQKYVVNQHYEKYTPINQAVWRYVMRQNHHFLKDNAHAAYVDGLKASGISVERIPNVNEMNEALEPYGWGAANISGFIPGVVFFDFQANGILPIASDIRKLENIQYTPAPDIIHEAAGHAPILLDKRFSDYVKLFGKIGSKALATKEEHELFDAIRDYSNLLESDRSTLEEIAAAKARFDERQAAVKEVSEAEQISRLYWWTVEYGLIGDMNKTQIYGAGLLSSVAEGRSSLLPSTKRLPFDLEQAINTGFDITKPQPQLFVCKSFDQLIDAVNAFADTMAFRVGGTASLEKALRSNHTATMEFSSGLQVTGTLTSLLKDELGVAVYLKTTGPTALAYENTELPGHGKATHQHGFGTPLGNLKGAATPFEEMSDDELLQYGIEAGKESTLQFNGGVVVTGIPVDFVRKNQKLQLVSFVNCTVRCNDELLFDPSWGTYDMAVGERITSVFAGAADSEQFYADLEPVVQKPVDQAELTPLERLYGKVRQFREETQNLNDLKDVIDQLNLFPLDWLLRIEVIEQLVIYNLFPETKALLIQQLDEMKSLNSEYSVLIERGLKLAL